MAWLVYPRVWDLWTGSGAGNPTLAGTPPSTYLTLSAVPGIAASDTAEYMIANRDANEWELGKLTYLGGNAFSRSPIKSSNAGSVVTFSAGTKDVFMCFATDVVSVGDEATIASGPTVDLSSTAGARVLVTGTTSITSFGTGANLLRWVRFAGALTLTYDATSLILPGAASITTAAGAAGLFASDGSGNWRCLFYQNGAAREVLSADRTYYVRTSGAASPGNDSNTGLADTAAGAFLTVQHGLNAAAAIDPSIYNVTVRVTGPVSEELILPGFIGTAASYNLIGDVTTPSNCTITNSLGFQLYSAVNWNVGGFKLVSDTFAIFPAAPGASITLTGKMDFGPGLYHLFPGSPGSQIIASADYTISGDATGAHMIVSAGAFIQANGRTITITGTPAIGSFASATDAGTIMLQGTIYSGAPATGSKKFTIAAGIIDTNGAGTSALPGDVPGTGGTTAGDGFYR